MERAIPEILVFGAKQELLERMSTLRENSALISKPALSEATRLIDQTLSELCKTQTETVEEWVSLSQLRQYPIRLNHYDKENGSEQFVLGVEAVLEYAESLPRVRQTGRVQVSSIRAPERKDCPMRHENGNCLPAGGFCTAVNDSICEALHNAYNSGECAAYEQVRARNYSLPHKNDK